MSDQLEPELERIARMLAEAGPLPDAPASMRERVLAIPDGGPTANGNVTDIGRRRRRPRAATLVGIAAAAIAIAAVPTVLVLRDDTTGRRIDLAPRTFAPKGGGTARVLARGDGTATIELTVWKLPDAGAGKTYEAWLGRKGDRLALGTFATDPTGKATISFRVPQGEMNAYRWLWVTSEPVGGSTQPSEDTALWGPLT